MKFLSVFRKVYAVLLPLSLLAVAASKGSLYGLSGIMFVLWFFYTVTGDNKTDKK